MLNDNENSSKSTLNDMRNLFTLQTIKEMKINTKDKNYLIKMYNDNKISD